MNCAINKLKFWHYLQGGFLYSVHGARLRKAVKILIAVVLGALLLFTLYKLFGDTVLPKLEEAINDMFGFGGAIDQLG